MTESRYNLWLKQYFLSLEQIKELNDSIVYLHSSGHNFVLFSLGIVLHFFQECSWTVIYGLLIKP
jgi:hypothetical protein